MYNAHFTRMHTRFKSKIPHEKLINPPKSQIIQNINNFIFYSFKEKKFFFKIGSHIA